ncbi:MAG: ROK family protein [Bacteroidetes bacterium]|nr:ROK family protein [Bacteroidota bacterium]MDA1120131.1 ROK family protein [Bacteroidota bacterium]
MGNKKVIGVDLGGTKILAARINGTSVEASSRQLVSSSGTKEQVISELISTIENVYDSSITGIGIGVPGIVDVEEGVLYDLQNIPSWKEVHLKEIIEAHFKIPVKVNNDANCFALGEKYFGKGKDEPNLVGLIVGTGMAAGIIINNKLHNGRNCGAGEFGMLPYLDHIYEYYSSGQFFTKVHHINGEQLYDKAKHGDSVSIQIFNDFGFHLGNAIIAILYSLDPGMIILGGSVSKAYEFYRKALWKRLDSFAFKPVIERLQIEVSEDPNIAVLGAAALIGN